MTGPAEGGDWPGEAERAEIDAEQEDDGRYASAVLAACHELLTRTQAEYLACRGLLAASRAREKEAVESNTALRKQLSAALANLAAVSAKLDAAVRPSYEARFPGAPKKARKQ